MIQENLIYSQDHEWVRIEEGFATIGISDHAQTELTDIVFVELPELGREVEIDDAIAVVESVKSASDIYAPLSGTIVEINESLIEQPGLINLEPYEEGWLFKIKLNDHKEAEQLLSASAYSDFINQ